jgi:lysozyme family protein
MPLGPLGTLGVLFYCLEISLTASSYDTALRCVLAHEGGYSNDARDPGGATNYGITIGDYRRYVDPHGTPADVRRMGVNEAKAIYRGKYWAAVHGDELPAGVDYAVFDFAVNSGVSRAAKYLQRIVGVAADGEIGPETLKAVAEHDPAEIIRTLCSQRLQFLQSLRTWRAFGKGWARRVADVRVVSLDMAQPQIATKGTTE